MSVLDKRVRRLEDLEGVNYPRRGIQIIVDPRKGETVESVQAAYVAEHGPLDGVSVIAWIVHHIADPPPRLH